jgi:thiol-disulfide isomerase/thioredoxin
VVHRVEKVNQNLNYNRSGRFGYPDHASFRHSLSGSERNYLFINDGAGFVDVAAVSGADHAGDARAFAKLDYDRDGWTDFAVMNANRPAFTLFRNEIGRRSGAGAAANQFIAVRFVGANRSAAATSRASNRDGIGARLWVSFGDEERVIEHQAGEGMAAQNSATELIGIGPERTVRGVRVRWPSGTEQASAEIPAGTLVSVYEDPSQSPQGTAFVFEAYRRGSGQAAELAAPRNEPDALPRFTPPAAAARVANDGLRLYTAMATWCPNCKKELGQLERIRAAFSEGEMAMFGVPVDDTETRAMFEQYVADNRPAYDMLATISAEEQATMRDTLRSRLGGDGIPATLVTDAADRVLHVSWGVPNLSTLLKLHALMEKNGKPIARQGGAAPR